MPKKQEKVRGVYEKVPGSGIWWCRYADAKGKIHREKVGRWSDAVDLYAKRRTEALQRKKLPERFRAKGITFRTLAKDALEHSRESNGERSTEELELKINTLLPVFGDLAAEHITKQDIIRWLASEGEKRDWSPATRNRWQAAFSLIFRVGLDNEKINVNPAARIKRRTENNGRIRFLSHEEEPTLREAIRDPKQLAAFEISLHTGMRRSEQFGLTWHQVDLERKMVFLPKTKSGKQRHIPLNAVALAAFERLKVKGQTKQSFVFPNASGEAVSGPRGWFEEAVTRAKLNDYTWHCNRHTFISRLVMAGVDLRTVAELAGHATIQMTMRYAHLAPSHTASAVGRLVPAPPAPKKRSGSQLAPQLAPAVLGARGRM
ncbi:MAG TPA: site-specific integrase [Acidobacteriaceae bacterium]|nr:site-specific integrase [Acidobacteriaceae bacterium]